MTPPAADQQPDGTSPPDGDAATGLPGLRTWRAVYLAVFALFAVWVVLLTVFTYSYR